MTRWWGGVAYVERAFGLCVIFLARIVKGGVRVAGSWKRTGRYGVRSWLGMEERQIRSNEACGAR